MVWQDYARHHREPPRWKPSRYNSFTVKESPAAAVRIPPNAKPAIACAPNDDRSECYALGEIWRSVGGQRSATIWAAHSGTQYCSWPKVTCGRDRRVHKLDLRLAGLVGPIPEALWALTSLRSLDLSDNGLTATLSPALGQLTELEQLDMSSNQLTGTIPNRALAKLSGLLSLKLADNALEGYLPPLLGDAANLTHIDLTHNKLSGRLPGAWGKLGALQTLKAEQNRLTGTLPAALLHGLGSLLFLGLSNNYISGAVPSSLGDMWQLQARAPPPLIKPTRAPRGPPSRELT